jgi:hypothetical protein
MIIFASYDAIKEAFLTRGTDFAGRPDQFAMINTEIFQDGKQLDCMQNNRSLQNKVIIHLLFYILMFKCHKCRSSWPSGKGFGPESFHHSTWYPLLLGGQRQCRMRNLPKVFNHDELEN